MALSSNDIGPAILNETLNLSVFHSTLIKSGMRVKVAKSTLPNSCIFPKISLAFLILFLTNNDIANSLTIQTRIKAFIDLHEQAFVVIVVNQLNKTTLQFVGNLQLKFHPQEINIIFVLNCTEAVEAIQNLSTMIHPRMKQMSHEKVNSFLFQFQDENVLLNSMQCFTFATVDDNTQLLKQFGSISALASTNRQELINVMSVEASDKISNFFEKNLVTEE